MVWNYKLNWMVLLVWNNDRFDTGNIHSHTDSSDWLSWSNIIQHHCGYCKLDCLWVYHMLQLYCICSTVEYPQSTIIDTPMCSSQSVLNYMTPTQQISYSSSHYTALWPYWLPLWWCSHSSLVPNTVTTVLDTHVTGYPLPWGLEMWPLLCTNTR